jgi:hypothetical protein
VSDLQVTALDQELASAGQDALTQAGLAPALPAATI